MIEQLTKALKNMAKSQRLAKNDPNNPQPKMAVPSNLGGVGKVTQKPAWLSQMQNSANAPQPTAPEPIAPEPKQYPPVESSADASYIFSRSKDPDEIMHVIKSPHFDAHSAYYFLNNPEVTKEHIGEASKRAGSSSFVGSILTHPKFDPSSFHDLAVNYVNHKKTLSPFDPVGKYLSSGRFVEPRTFDALLSNPEVVNNLHTLGHVASSPLIQPQQLEKLFRDGMMKHGDYARYYLESIIAEHHKAPERMLREMAAKKDNPSIRKIVASNPATPEDLRNHLMTQDPHPDVRRAAEVGFHRVFDNRAQ